MKKSVLILSLMTVISSLCYAQDEGAIVKRQRIERDKGIYFDLGPSFTLGKNIGDYSTGFSFEMGYNKRLNRVLSIGPSFSYVKFNYDPVKTGLNNAAIEGPFNDQQVPYYVGYVLNLEGGDLSLTSLGFNLKLNLVPVRDDSKVSVYAFAKPFIAMANRSELSGSLDVYVNIADIGNDEDWGEPVITEPVDVNDFEQWKSSSDITGGIFVGPGIEFNPAKSFSFFAQFSFGYTFPVDFISTSDYENVSLEDSPERYPLVKKGFPAVNFQVGGCFNF